MAETKTRPTLTEITAFLDAVDHPVRRADGHALRALFERISGEPATLWGSSIVGFGSYHYRYDSGHQGESLRIGFSPRKANLVLYVGNYEGYDSDLARLGKHKTSVACLYLNKLADVDLSVLETVIRRSWDTSARNASA